MHFWKTCIRPRIYVREIGIKSGIHFGKFGIRNGYVFEASMARPRPKSGQVPPGGPTSDPVPKRQSTMKKRSLLSDKNVTEIVSTFSFDITQIFS